MSRSCFILVRPTDVRAVGSPIAFSRLRFRCSGHRPLALPKGATIALVITCEIEAPELLMAIKQQCRA